MTMDVKYLGRLARDPERKTLPSGVKCVAFPFVTDAGAKGQDGKRKPLFSGVTVWGKQGDDIIKYCQKGTQLSITGHVYDNTAYTGKDGTARPNLCITLEKFEFTSSKKEVQPNIQGEEPAIPF